MAEDQDYAGPIAETPEDTPEQRSMDGVDAALAPIFRNSGSGVGVVHHSELMHAARCFRQALACVIFPPEPVAAPGESLDVHGDQIRAQRAAQVGEPVPVFVEPVADDAATEKLFA